MFKRFSTNYMAVLLLVDVILIQCALWLAMQLRFWLPLGSAVLPEWVPQWVYRPTVELHVAVGALWLAAFLVASVYTPRRIIHWYDEYQRLGLAHTTASLSLAGALYLAQVELPRLTFLYFYLLVLVALLGCRSLLRLWHRMQRNTPSGVARILIIGAGPVGRNLVKEFQRQQWPGLEFIGFLDDDANIRLTKPMGLPVLGRVEQVAQVAADHNVDEVIIALPQRAHVRLVDLVAMLQASPVRVRVVPDYFELAFFGATIENLGGIPLIGLRDPAIDGVQRLVKRLIDMIISSVGLLLLTPLLLITAIAIKLSDSGPIFYRAERIGENGRRFHMLKFRSMVVDAEKLQDLVNQVGETGSLFYKRPDDPRITPIGRFIRRTSIDELPQLWNVLKGEMSLVGPRPELPWLVDKYEPWQRKRFAVPQGITGWWQVNGRSDKPMHLHSEEDLYYIRNYSLWLDIQILWKTVFAVLKRKGAY
jgi:exopolysaccharide biosynthesis polyprenyl glycosylphosphotransferase